MSEDGDRQTARDPEELQLSKPPQEMIIAPTCMYYRCHCAFSFVNFLDWLRCRHSWHGFWLLCKFCYCDCVDIFCRMGAFWNLGISAMCHFFCKKGQIVPVGAMHRYCPNLGMGLTQTLLKIVISHVLSRHRRKKDQVAWIGVQCQKVNILSLLSLSIRYMQCDKYHKITVSHQLKLY